MSATLDLTKALIRQASVTPFDADCQAMLADRLAKVGFHNESMVFADVTNLYSRRGTESPLLCFVGHTDVVPTGDVAAWKYPPFEPTVEGDLLYGRGTADMKGSIAAFMVAVERFVAKHPNHKGSIAVLITSDEEGEAIHGTEKVVEALLARNERIDMALVGEPSSTNFAGDTIKNGRRGSMMAYLTVKGIQGHVAYPHLARNPIHQMAPALAELASTVWDEGNAFFPPTSFQVANIQGGTGASNVIPGTVNLMCSFRYCTESTPESLQQRMRAILDQHGLEYDVRFDVKGLPFLTDAGALVEATVKAVQATIGHTPELSTAGGTSDGRFIAPHGAQVVELGPVNKTIHQINEHVSVSDLDKLTDMYERTLEALFA